jgi:hypothetical protein
MRVTRKRDERRQALQTHVHTVLACFGACGITVGLFPVEVGLRSGGGGAQRLPVLEGGRAHIIGKAGRALRESPQARNTVTGRSVPTGIGPGPDAILVIRV